MSRIVLLSAKRVFCRSAIVEMLRAIALVIVFREVSSIEKLLRHAFVSYLAQIAQIVTRFDYFSDAEEGRYK